MQGSAEAVRESVLGLADSEVGVKVVAEGVGPVTTTDVDTARATGACILAFNVKYANAAVEGVAKVQAVKVVEHRIIYRMLEEVLALFAFTVPCPSLPCPALHCSGMLCCAVLCCAVRSRATLCGAVRCRAVPCFPMLCCAALCCAVLCCAVLCHAMLRHSSPSFASSAITLSDVSGLA